MDPELALQSLVDLQKDRETKTLIDQIQTVPEQEKGPIVEAFYKRALSVISKYKQEEKERDEQEIARMQKGIERLAKELRELESARVKDYDQMNSLRGKMQHKQDELDNYRKIPF